MQVTPSAQRPFPTPPTPNAPDPESARFANRDTVVLPDEMVIKILMNLGTTDIAVCRSVSRQWQTLIDTSHLLARSFYRDCHVARRIDSLTFERNLAAQRYHSHIRGWLIDFGNGGRETAKQLDNILGDVHFPEVLFFSIPKLLLNSNELTYQNTATIRHLGIVRDASFSPDGKYLVAASIDTVAKLSELEGGQWREKVTLRHCAYVYSASFTPDGKLLVTVSGYDICKIWRLEDDQWQEKATNELSHAVRDASFSPDGKHLVVVSGDGVCKIWRLGDHQWQEKATIQYSTILRNASFSPDGKHLVTTFVDGPVKIWELDDGQWEEKFTIHGSYSAIKARLSPDGKHLVTVTHGVNSGDPIRCDCVKLWELEGDQSQEKVTIQHSGVVGDVHFSPDGKHLVTASWDGTANIYGLEDGKWQIKTTIRHSGSVANARFSQDGKLLVTASDEDCTTKICGLVGGKWQEKGTIQHSKAVTNASFGPDYQIVTAYSDSTAKIWVLKNKENDDNS